MARSKPRFAIAIALLAFAGLFLLSKPILVIWRVEQLCNRVSWGVWENGEEIYSKRCAQCHPGIGPDLHPAGSRARDAKEGLYYLVQSIVDPDAVVAPAMGYRIQFRMPAVRLSDQEVLDVVSYVMDLPPKSGR